MAQDSITPMASSPTSSTPFVDRRNYDAGAKPTPFGERRQFANSHEGLTPPAKELALAIDEYKLRHRRRYITYEEMLKVILELGYSKEIR